MPIRSVNLIFTRGHISLPVAFKGPNVILGLYKCNYSTLPLDFVLVSFIVAPVEVDEGGGTGWGGVEGRGQNADNCN